MKHLILASLMIFTASAFAADPTPLQLSRILQIKSVQQALAHVEGSVGQIAVTAELTGGMESTGYFITIRLTGRADKADNALKDCEIDVEILGPKYANNGQLNDIRFDLTKEDLRTMPIANETCSANRTR